MASLYQTIPGAATFQQRQGHLKSCAAPSSTRAVRGIREKKTGLQKLPDDRQARRPQFLHLQIHAGGRGKGGGVKLAKNRDEVEEEN